MSKARPDSESGLRMIDTVLGDGISAYFAGSTDPLIQDTTDHLFGEIWSRPGLSVRDRRLLTMGVIAASGQADTFAAHASGALKSGDLDPDQLREIVLHLAYYAGAGNATMISRGLADALAKYQAE